jgi:hypothetical protein
VAVSLAAVVTATLPLPSAAYASPAFVTAAPCSTGGGWESTSAGHVVPFGGAPSLGSITVPLHDPIVAMASSPDGRGYWLTASDGGVFTFGDAPYYGSTGGIHLNKPITAMASSPDGRGYWLTASDGGVFTFGDAHFYGSTGNLHLAAPVVGIVLGPERPFAGPPPAGGPPPPTPAGGYALVARDGGVFTFGNAPFLGSGAGKHDGTAILGMSATQ